MKLGFLLGGFGLGLVLLSPVGAHAQSSANSPAEQAAPGAEQVAASRAFIAAVDVERLYHDQDYAREVLRHLDVLQTATTDSRQSVAIDSLRLLALPVLHDGDQIGIVVDRTLARRPVDPAPYNSAWWAALSAEDLSRAVRVAEAASRNVPGVGWADLRAAWGPLVPGYVLNRLERNHEDELRTRFAEALFRIGWPGPGFLERTNDVRLILIERRFENHQIREARDLAEGLTDPVSLLPLLVLRKYDSLLEPDVDRVARLRNALAEYDRLTLDALGGEARAGAAFERARLFRRLGREREAYALLEPFTHDIEATVASDYRGMWVINEAAYSLLNLGRNDEAVALMQRLVALPVAENTELIGPFINHATILTEAGRPAEALEWAGRLDREFSQYANDYGKREIAGATICALAALNRVDDAGPMMERIRAGGDSSLGQLTEAYMCLGDIDAAERVVIQRLQGADAESLVIAFQEYQLRDDGAHLSGPMSERWAELRRRPAIRAAVERVGHILQLPLAYLRFGGN